MAGFWSRGSKYELVIPLRPEDCAERIRPYIQPVFSMSSDRPLRGQVSARSFSLCRNSPKFRNSFAAFASGRWEAEGARTRVVMRVGVNQVVILFMGLWFGMLGLATLAIWLGVLTGQAPLLMGLGPLLMAVMGVGMVVVGTRLGQDDEAVLVKTLEQALKVSARRLEA